MATTNVSHSCLRGAADSLQRAGQQSEETKQPRSSLHTRFAHRDVTFSDIPTTLDTETVLVIEDISTEWAEWLKNGLNINPAFFANHNQRDIHDRDLWTSIMGATPTESIQERRLKLYDGIRTSTSAYWWHLDAISTTADAGKRCRHCLNRDSDRPKNGLDVQTRISLWRSDKFCLILIDSLPNGKLRIPVSRNRGGLHAPLLHHSLYDTVCSFLSHQLHIYAIFGRQPHEAISPVLFSYYLVGSTWKTLLRNLDASAKHIGFEEIRQPTVLINSQLHDLRRDLDMLRKEVDRIIEWMPSEVEEELQRIKLSTSRHIGSVETNCKQVLADCLLLERFIMDSCTLALSSIGVREAEVSAKTAQRAQQLTTLAFIYVPLSFVTSVFGMNIREINGSPTPAWIVTVACAIMSCLTLIMLLAWHFASKIRASSAGGHQSEV